MPCVDGDRTEDHYFLFAKLTYILECSSHCKLFSHINRKNKFENIYRTNTEVWQTHIFFSSIKKKIQQTIFTYIWTFKFEVQFHVLNFQPLMNKLHL